ncbi:MAG: hypothetical protein AAGD01_06400 [Acidobacteriota bacterium]
MRSLTSLPLSQPVFSLASALLPALLSMLLLASVAPLSLMAAESGEAPILYALERYEVVRLALLHDTTEGVAEAAADLESALRELTASDLSVAVAGVSRDELESARELAPLLYEAAGGLATAEGLAATRDAFYELTKPLVRYRALMVVDVPSVAYCPMAKRSWLQPAGEIGNPYHGQSMARCGELIED